MFKFGLIEDDGVWNIPSTDIYYGHYFQGYKPVQSYEIFGLINSTDGNFWLMKEDDDHYWTTAKISEETIRNLYNSLKYNDYKNTAEYSFSFQEKLLTIELVNIQNNKNVNITFDKHWVADLIKTLDIDTPVQTTKEILPIWEKSIVPDKIDYPLMNPEEHVYQQILLYPSLYGNKDFEISKFKAYDHIFNTIGAGYHSIDDIKEELSKKSEIDIKRAKRFCSEISYDGYSKVKTFSVGDREITLPEINDCVARNIFEEEKSQFSNVILWIPNNPDKNINDIVLERKGIVKDTKFQPYPNFQKEYSIIWKEAEVLELLTDEWKNEIIWFYETSLNAINNGCFLDYSEFPTGSEKEDQKRIEEMSKRIKDKTQEQISNDYEVEFDGDISEFLTKIWLKTKKEYISFIQETVELIKMV